MAGSTTIEWTQKSWNPVTGCSKVSQGCKFCYAERMAKRLQGMGLPQYRNGFDVMLAPHVLEQPLRWRSPTIIFVNSMSDLFHERVPLAYINRVFAVMEKTPWHTYQILTKRSERLASLSTLLSWPANIWIGVSVENQATTFRISDLKHIPASVRFLSLEPLLGSLGDLDLVGINWVIVGGESGPRARPMRREWVVSIMEQCRRYGVPFFFKQWGRARANPDPADPTINKTHPDHAKGGCQLDGRLHREMPSPAVT